jgi:hypothetical protein
MDYLYETIANTISPAKRLRAGELYNYRGHLVADMRMWVNRGDKWIPTKNGIMAPARDFIVVIAPAMAQFANYLQAKADKDGANYQLSVQTFPGPNLKGSDGSLAVASYSKLASVKASNR